MSRKSGNIFSNNVKYSDIQHAVAYPRIPYRSQIKGWFVSYAYRVYVCTYIPHFLAECHFLSGISLL